jgi:hypothetical protein
MQRLNKSFSTASELHRLRQNLVKYLREFGETPLLEPSKKFDKPVRMIEFSLDSLVKTGQVIRCPRYRRPSTSRITWSIGEE